MQIVSSVYSGGKTPRVHFEAPPAKQIGTEMAAFLAWFNATAATGDLVRAGIAHFWFVTIHPLDDGNGRIGRAIADMAIAQAEGSGQRFYSLSSAILRDRRGYYAALERASQGDLDITAWLLWFLRRHMQAISHAEITASRVIATGHFWAAMDGLRRPLNDRQRKMITRLLEGWEGLVTTRKWAAICACSTDTAQRDIAGLVEIGLLQANTKGGRSRGYIVVMPASLREQTVP
jgi:Fic family protein